MNLHRVGIGMILVPIFLCVSCAANGPEALAAPEPKPDPEVVVRGEEILAQAAEKILSARTFQLKIEIMERKDGGPLKEVGEGLFAFENPHGDGDRKHPTRFAFRFRRLAPRDRSSAVWLFDGKTHVRRRTDSTGTEHYEARHEECDADQALRLQVLSLVLGGTTHNALSGWHWYGPRIVRDVEDHIGYGTVQSVGTKELNGRSCQVVAYRRLLRDDLLTRARARSLGFVRDDVVDRSKVEVWVDSETKLVVRIDVRGDRCVEHHTVIPTGDRLDQALFETPRQEGRE